MKKYLEQFEKSPRETPTGPEQQHIVDWLSAKGYGFSARNYANPSAEMTRFSGTYHCETVLVFLFLIGRERDELVERQAQPGNVEDEENHLRLPHAEITKAFQEPFKVLPVSKRCCPACHALINHIILGRRMINLLYPGNHAVWSAAAFPPWISREAGMAVLEAAKAVVRDRFHRMIS